MTGPATSSASARPTQLGRSLGRFELLRLLGKSQGSMVWLVNDPQLHQELVLTLPRVQPVDPAALEHWLTQVRHAARLDHPNLTQGVEVAVQEQWPFLAVDRSKGVTLGEWLALHPNPSPIEAVGWVCQILEGVAFAHESGTAHHDLQLHSLLINDAGRVQVMALATSSGQGTPVPADAAKRGVDQSMLVEADALRAHREASERDVLACGLLLHLLLTGAPVLDEPDIAKAMLRLPPAGRDLVRLPWSTPHPIPEALRAIANRCTTSQDRQRYLSARTFLRALQGWLEAEALGRDGPLELMLDRLRTVGALPALPGMSARVERMAAMDGQHVEAISHLILQDMALSFELLREVNSVHVQGTQAAGSAPVLTIRRSIALVGLNGVRQAANGLRLWPGPLSDAGAQALRTLMDRVRLAGYTAQALRPPGYDAEVVYLVAVLQNLGRLLAQYHFPDESEQIRYLMHGTPAAADAPSGTPAAPGWAESDASFAVLGIDIEALGAAVARHWGLGDEMLHMIRRLPKDLPVRTPDSDSDVLRITASAANEAVDAARSPGAITGAASDGRSDAAVGAEAPVTSKSSRGGTPRTSVAQRYARSLGLTPRIIQESLDAARHALRTGTTVQSASSRPDVDPVAAQPAAAAS
ncbi:MAG: HDOD domain-containing protein [Pseudomonadota bacterium]|nr:HDOD domain-containing protein [Pseudomonadota bacterium]